MENNLKKAIALVVKKISESDGVSVFIDDYRPGFENWLQVEMCGILKEMGYKINKNFFIEYSFKSSEGKTKSIDLCFSDDRTFCAVEFKVIVRTSIGKKSNRNIATGLGPILADVEKLEGIRLNRELLCVSYFVLFMFPFHFDSEEKIMAELKTKAYWKDIGNRTEPVDFKVVYFKDSVTKGAVFLLKGIYGA
jgi:hypothetical protein